MRALALALLLLPAVAQADPRPLRLLGESSAGHRFVVDAVLEEGSGPLALSVDDGWFAVLDGPDWKSGELNGQCVEDRCAFSVSQDEGDLVLAGDFLGPGAARFEMGAAKGSLTLRPLAGDVPGLGPLAPADAVTAAGLDELLAWAGYQSGYFNPSEDEPPGDSERELLAEWQAANGRPASGLILAPDLAALRAEADAARAKVGWTEIDNVQGGWRMGYPAALLRSLSASSSPAERRFASDDGKALLVVGADAPISEDAWDAFVDSRKEGADGYTRVNDDFELQAAKDGVATAEAHHHGERSQRRMVLTYPESEAETWAPLATLMQKSFRRGSAKD